MAADSVDYKAANGQRISMYRMGRSAMVALQEHQNDEFHFRTEERHQGGAIGGHLIICDGDAALKESSISRQRLSAKMHKLKLKIVCGKPGAPFCITSAMR